MTKGDFQSILGVGSVAEYVACCDIGGTKVLLGLVGEEGKLLAKEKYLVGEKKASAALLPELACRLDGLLHRLGLSRGDLLGLGCSMAAMMDLSRGFVYSAPPLGWQDFPLQQALEAALHLPAAIEMDAYAMALGEALYGAGAGRQHLVGIVVGTGIGAGLILDGRPYHGCSGLAGEFGHMVIAPDGPACNCGGFGCLEALASGTAIAMRARGALEQSRSTLIREMVDGKVKCVTSETVFAAARQGDEVAWEVIGDAARYLGIGIANLITLLNVEAVVLGGGVIHGGADLLLPLITRAVDAHRGYWTRAVEVQILAGMLGEDAALLGAAETIRTVMSLDTAKAP